MLEIKVTMTIREHWASNTQENRIVKEMLIRCCDPEREREMANLSVEGKKFLIF